MGILLEIKIYTDGACIGNPGRGGYGVVILSNGERVELSGGFRSTTNNRMEIMAAIVGLESLQTRSKVTIFSDSQYLVDAMMKGWARRWKSNNWKRNTKSRAINVDLWKRLLDLCSKHEVEFVWVRGHSGIAENERCDLLANEAAFHPDLPLDSGYEGGRNPFEQPSEPSPVSKALPLPKLIKKAR